MSTLIWLKLRLSICIIQYQINASVRGATASPDLMSFLSCYEWKGLTVCLSSISVWLNHMHSQGIERLLPRTIDRKWCVPVMEKKHSCRSFHQHPTDFHHMSTCSESQEDFPLPGDNLRTFEHHILPTVNGIHMLNSALPTILHTVTQLKLWQLGNCDWRVRGNRFI